MDWQLLDDNWQRRHEPDALQAVKEFFSLAAPDSDAEAYAWRWRRARLLHFLAMQAVVSNQDAPATQLFSESAAEAKQAMAVGKFGVEGQFWFGASALEAARRKGVMVMGAVFGAASKSIEQAMQIDEAYNFAGPVRVWGRIQQFKPLMLGGSLDRAIASYHRALQIAPDNSTSLLYYAEALWADRQPKPARAACEKILSDPDAPEWMWEQARDRPLAAKLLEEINRSRDS